MLVGCGGGSSAVPHLPFGIAGLVAGLAEPVMRASPVGVASSVVDGRPDQRVREASPVAGSFNQPGRFSRRFGGICIYARSCGCVPNPTAITGHVGGSQEQKLLYVGRQAVHLAQVSLLQLPAHWDRFGQIGACGQFRTREMGTDLHES